MIRRVIAGTVLVLTLAVVPNALAAPKHYYVALGDSLSVGYQPGANGQGIETKQGFTNDLRSRYARTIKHLRLIDFGCPGDTTSNLLTGKGNTASASHYRCNRRHGSQLAAAVHFLKAHHHAGEVPLVTIDIGANDVVPCASQPSAGLILSCVGAGEKTIQTNTPKILKALRKAAPKGTKLVAMNLYDPILADELSSNSSLQALGQLSLSLVKGINADIATADRRAHFKTADVAGAFGTYNITPELYLGQQVPTDVANICELTWMCAAPPIGPNIHANQTGYAVIAQAFETVIGKLK